MDLLDWHKWDTLRGSIGVLVFFVCISALNLVCPGSGALRKDSIRVPWERTLIRSYFRMHILWSYKLLNWFFTVAGILGAFQDDSMIQFDILFYLGSRLFPPQDMLWYLRCFLAHKSLIMSGAWRLVLCVLATVVSVLVTVRLNSGWLFMHAVYTTVPIGLHFSIVANCWI